MKKKPNCIGIVRKQDGKLRYYWCKLQFWKYSSMRLSGAEDGALSYAAYDPRWEENQADKIPVDYQDRDDI